MQQAALFRRERQLGQMKQTTITAVLTEIKFRNKRKTASIAHVISESWHENASKMHGKNSRKVA
jgi:hypothetical protein